MMAILFQFSVVLLVLLLAVDGLQKTTVSDYLDVCLDGRHHKKKPGPEGSLYKQCTPWKKRACCQANVTKTVHSGDMYNFSWNHCKKLSPKCTQHFLQDLCFYECTPNGGPWIVKDPNMKIRKERYLGMPLCKNECQNWWDSCRDDETCIENWTRGFNWTTGRNTCPTGTKCRKFSEVFTSAADFCEKIWDHTWKVVPPTEPCFRLWFDGNGKNPNDVISIIKAKNLLSHGCIHKGFFHMIFLGFFLAILGPL